MLFSVAGRVAPRTGERHGRPDSEHSARGRLEGARPDGLHRRGQPRHAAAAPVPAQSRRGGGGAVRRLRALPAARRVGLRSALPPVGAQGARAVVPRAGRRAPAARGRGRGARRGGDVPALRGLARAARRPGGRRGLHRDAGPLARDHDDRRDPRRQGRLLREAAHGGGVRGARDDRGAEGLAADRRGGPEPPRVRSLPAPQEGARLRQVRHGPPRPRGAHEQLLPERHRRVPAERSAEGPRLGRVARPARGAALPVHDGAPGACTTSTRCAG